MELKNSAFALFWTTAYYLLFPLVGLFVWHQWKTYRHLSEFKGPFWASMTNIWMAKGVTSGQVYQKVYDISNKHGDLIRVGPNTLYTNDPELVHRMSAVRSPYVRSKWYNGQRLEANSHQVLSLTDEGMHTKRRAQVAIGYSGKEIDGLEDTIDKHVVSFVNMIRRKYLTVGSKLQPFDLGRRTSFFTMDVITDVAFGQPWGFIDADNDVDDWLKSTEEFLPAATLISTLPWLSKLIDIPFISQFIMPSDQDKTGPGKLLRIITDVVESRFGLEDSQQKRDMMGSFLRHGLTKSQAVSEASLQIIAGSDTTATAIRTTMLFILTNPHIHTKLRAEIDEISNIGKNSVISSAKSRSLPYLQAVIKEGLRMWPPSTLPVLKVVPPEGDTFNGKFIPGGTEIGSNTWAIQRNQKIYGEDSELFRPERWLEGSEGTLQKMERTLGVVFGSGKYVCLGKNIAMMELDKILFELLRNFNFEVINPSQPWRVRNYGIWFQDRFFLKVTERVGA